MDASRFEPQDPDFAERVRASFAKQGAMQTLGATLAELEPGRAAIELAWQQGLTQQHGFLHAGMVAAALDSACGYAASTLMPADAGVLTIEYKINLLAPAQGQRFRMHGLVLKPGRTITVAEGRAFAIDNGREKLIASMTATLMTITGRENIRH
ncbi:PaaI family thioesterase [Ramlibacter ginsenosidimutans]|uniref:Medium/long-chain acyl-CoA thioesterase YigI n=1 Tax=Ramlibacter ginsenosidimutans TaxID=502333 RepID=A0A934TRI3_9BURK|nr:PaaI family thioesterase [Ramlibacter ginsenosidimutans]MBK6006206.1 PaaI family thioesterase [Ramlibacter ginsenosidimutans]